MAKSAVLVFSLSDAGEAREYKKRRLHSKTATGCLVCREKRVKCDELKPTCARCVRNDRCCAYERSLAIDELCTVLPAVQTEPSLTDMQLMKYCQQNWKEVFDIPGMDTVLKVAADHRVLHNAICAVAATHMCHRLPTQQHRIAKHFYQSEALHECQQHVADSHAVRGQPAVNALVLSALLLNMLAFNLPETENEDDLELSWVLSEDKNRLGWLTLQEGLRHLLRATDKQLPATLDFLTQIYIVGDSPPKSWITYRVADVPETWQRFFELEEAQDDVSDDCETVHGSVFRPAVNVLLKLTQPVVEVKIFHFFPFLLKINNDLRSLLYRRDAKTIWLLGYWYALLVGSKALWWSHKRLRRDYRAIRLWLAQADMVTLPGEQGCLWRVMMSELDDVIIP